MKTGTKVGIIVSALVLIAGASYLYLANKKEEEEIIINPVDELDDVDLDEDDDLFLED